MKKLILPAIAALALFSACKKDNSTSPSTNGQYYYKATIGGNAVNLSSTIPQYIFGYSNEAGGYMISGNNLLPSLSLDMFFSDTVSNSEILGLAGQNISFDNNAATYVMINYQAAVNDSTSYTSVDTTSSNYFVHINTMTYLKVDTVLGNPVDVYVANGTCNAVLESDVNIGEYKTLTNGSFNFMISRNRY